jgi:hypothetical protein
MMRNDDIDEIDLSRHRPSRLPGVLIIGCAVGVALIAAWFFTPLLISRDSATTASLLSAPKAAPPAKSQGTAVASAQATPVAPAADTTVTAAANNPPPAPAPAPAAAGPETTASTPWPSQAWPRPQSRGIQVAAAPPAVTPPEAETAVPAAAATAQDIPADSSENVPLPRKRPSRLIAASLAIPLPRPRPEIELDAPAGPPTTFDLQVERMR